VKTVSDKAVRHSLA